MVLERRRRLGHPDQRRAPRQEDVMTAIDDELDGLDPVDLMGREAARIEAFFATLPDDGWQRPSRCPGWSTRDVLAHLLASEGYFHACLEGRVAALIATATEGGELDLAAFNERGIASVRDL